nr:MAG TPA: hypothetical protein [Caudoviricetes sp.]
MIIVFWGNVNVYYYVLFAQLTVLYSRLFLCIVSIAFSSIIVYHIVITMIRKEFYNEITKPNNFVCRSI